MLCAIYEQSTKIEKEEEEERRSNKNLWTCEWPSWAFDSSQFLSFQLINIPFEHCVQTFLVRACSLFFIINNNKNRDGFEILFYFRCDCFGSHSRTGQKGTISVIIVPLCTVKIHLHSTIWFSEVRTC